MLVDDDNYIMFYDAIIIICVNLIFQNDFNIDKLTMLKNIFVQRIENTPNELLAIINDIRFLPETNEYTISVLNSFENYIRIAADIKYKGIMPKQYCYISSNQYRNTLTEFILFIALNWKNPMPLLDLTLEMHLKDNESIVKEAVDFALYFFIKSSADMVNKEAGFSAVMELHEKIM